MHWDEEDCEFISDVMNRIFRPEATTCFAFDKYGTSVYPIAQFNSLPFQPEFFSINELTTHRLDENVVSLHNILIEMDKGTLDQQLRLFNYLPDVTTLIHSGGKSLHGIIHVEDGFESRDDYRAFAEAIHKKLNNIGKTALKIEKMVDETCKNPSRLSRFPLAHRRDKNAVQYVHSVGSALKLNDVLSFLGFDPRKKTKDATKPKFIDNRRKFSKWANDIFESNVRVDTGERNSTTYRLACECFEVGFDFEETVAAVDIFGLPTNEVYQTVTSAERRIQNKIVSLSNSGHGR